MAVKSRMFSNACVSMAVTLAGIARVRRSVSEKMPVAISVTLIHNFTTWVSLSMKVMVSAGSMRTPSTSIFVTFSVLESTRTGSP